MALTTLAKVKTQAGITGTDSDAALTAIIAGVDAYIKGFTNRILEQDTVVLSIDGSGGAQLQVPDYPITAVTLLEQETSFNVFTTIAAANYKVDEENGIITLDHKSVNGHKNYRVSADVGYVTVPDDLCQAATQMSISEFNQRSGGGDVESERIGDYSVTYRKDSGGSDGNANASGKGDAFIDGVMARYKKMRARFNT